MTGRYVIYTPRESWLDSRQFDKSWHTFVALCRSLDEDGLDYAVQFHLAADRPRVLVTASGTRQRRKQRAAVRRLTLPLPIPAQRCAIHAQEAEWFLPENRTRRNSATKHWRHRGDRFNELNAMAEDELQAEVEFWHEMELLSGQREHFKPGRTDESAQHDDEVAARATPTGSSDLFTRGRTLFRPHSIARKSLRGGARRRTHYEAIGRTGGISAPGVRRTA